MLHLWPYLGAWSGHKGSSPHPISISLRLALHCLVPACVPPVPLPQGPVIYALPPSPPILPGGQAWQSAPAEFGLKRVISCNFNTPKHF